MPTAAIPLITAGAGIVSGALSKKGKQGGQSATTSNQQTTNQAQNINTAANTLQNVLSGNIGTTNQQGVQLPVEDPLFTMGRQKLLDTIGGEIGRAKSQPIFGQAQIAQMLDTLNTTAGGAFNRLKSNLASVGALDSGRLGQGATDIELGRGAEISRFFRDLPFAEEQARQARLNPLLALQMQLTGKSPLGQLSTQAGTTAQQGFQSGQTTSTGQQTSLGQTNVSGTGQTDQSEFGPGFWPALFGGIAGGLGASQGQAGQPTLGGSLLDLFKKNAQNAQVGLAGGGGGLYSPGWTP